MHLLQSWNYYKILKWFLKKLVLIKKYIEKLQFLIVYVSHNEEHYGRWKSSMSLKTTLSRDLSCRHPLQEATKVSQTPLSPFASMHEAFHSLKRHKMAPLVLLG